VWADAAILQTITNDVALSENYNLLISIPAIGSPTAAIVELPSATVLCTAREAAAYAGLTSS
jgi:hypothetical protein